MLRVKSLMLTGHVRRLGSIRSGGGSISKRGETHEEEYFYKQRQEQLSKLKQKKISDKDFVTERIKKHQEAMEYHEKMIEEYKSGKKIEEVKEKLKNVD